MWDQAHIRLRLCPHDHQPQWKTLKRIIYVWLWPAVSMKWVGWLITKSCYKWETKWQVNLLQLPLWCETKHISGWGCVLMTTSHSGRCWNALYMYEVDLIWVWSGWGASSLNHNLQHAASERPSESPTAATWHQAHIRLRLCPHARQPQWKMLKRILCMKLTWYEYEVGGVPQS